MKMNVASNAKTVTYSDTAGTWIDGNNSLFSLFREENKGTGLGR